MKKVLSSKIIFAAIVLLVAFIGSYSNARALIIRTLIKAGLHEPDVSNLTLKAVALPEVRPAKRHMPDLLFKDINGKTFSINELKGKVVFLNFWATWCPPCIAEMPSINSLYNGVRSNPNIVFLMVDIDGSAPRAAGFMKRKAFDLPVHTSASKIPKAVFSGSIPTTLIVDKSGSIVFHHKNMADYSAQSMRDFLLALSKY